MGRIVPNLGGTTTGGASYTKTETDAKYIAKSGDTMSGDLSFATSSVGVVQVDSDGGNWRTGVNPDGAQTTTSI